MTNTFKPKIITYVFYSGNTLERYIDNEDEWDIAERQALNMSPPALRFVDKCGYNISANIKNVEFMSWENSDES